MKGVTIKYKSNKGIRISGTRCWVIIALENSRMLTIMNIGGRYWKMLRHIECDIYIYIIKIGCQKFKAAVIGGLSAQEGCEERI